MMMIKMRDSWYRRKVLEFAAKRDTIKDKLVHPSFRSSEEKAAWNEIWAALEEYV